MPCSQYVSCPRQLQSEISQRLRWLRDFFRSHIPAMVLHASLSLRCPSGQSSCTKRPNSSEKQVMSQPSPWAPEVIPPLCPSRRSLTHHCLHFERGVECGVLPAGEVMRRWEFWADACDDVGFECDATFGLCWIITEYCGCECVKLPKKSQGPKSLRNFSLHSCKITRAS